MAEAEGEPDAEPDCEDEDEDEEAVEGGGITVRILRRVLLLRPAARREPGER